MQGEIRQIQNQNKQCQQVVVKIEFKMNYNKQDKEHYEWIQSIYIIKKINHTSQTKQYWGECIKQKGLKYKKLDKNTIMVSILSSSLLELNTTIRQ